MMPINFVDLMHGANKRLNENDPIFVDKVETVLAILRSKRVVSSQRISQNGAYHSLLAATLVLAHERKESFVLPTRHQQKLYELGVSTRVVSFLDKAVESELIETQSPLNKALGPLTLGKLITSYLSQ